jgi:hypothetical protein
VRSTIHNDRRIRRPKYVIHGFGGRGKPGNASGKDENDDRLLGNQCRTPFTVSPILHSDMILSRSNFRLERWTPFSGQINQLCAAANFMGKAVGGGRTPLTI